MHRHHRHHFNLALAILLFFAESAVILGISFLNTKVPEANADITTGLAAYWNFEEGGGSVAGDSSGNGNTATWGGTGTHWATGKIGNFAAQFTNNLGDQLSVGAGTNLPMPTATSEFTLSAWVKTLAISASIFSFRDGINDFPVIDLQVGFDGLDGGSGIPSFLVRDDNGGGLTHTHATAAVNDNNWHLITATRNSSKLDTIYVDAVPMASTTDSMSASVTTSNKMIGYEPRNGLIAGMNGLIDDARIYNRALTITDVQELYALGSPVRSKGSPVNTLPAGTTQTTISLDTDVSATCKYSTSSGVLYSSMPNTFSTTGGAAHSTLVTGLINGGSYIYYVRCADLQGNANITDYIISFSIAAPVSKTGFLFSSVYDSGLTNGATLNSIMWLGSQPAGTTVQFQIATSNSSTGPWAYLGPDGTNATYFSPTGPNAPVRVGAITAGGAALNNKRYFRYEVFLNSDVNQTLTPVVNDVILNWSR